MTEVGEKRYYTRKEASRILNRSGSDIRNLVLSGQLQYEYVEGRYMLPARSLEAFRQGGRQGGRSGPHEQQQASSEDTAPVVVHPGSEATVNEFVAYLNRYTTVSPEQEAAFDEFSSQSDPPSGKKLQLQTKVESFIRDRFSTPNPPSIILTGNAGDGKTYLCRQVIETFAEQNVADWTDHTDWRIERAGVTMRVVKDLSEVSEESGGEILRDLDGNLKSEGQPQVFMIAANEGRLRSVLESNGLRELNDRIDRQLREGPDTENDRLIVFNLNKATTSTYVAQALRWITDPVHWSGCGGCAALDGCPIRFNVEKLSQEHVVERFTLLYRTLEHLGVHVTIRDMLIHLAYTVTGGLTCDKVAEALLEPGHELHYALHKHVYYENCWGGEASSVDQRNVSVVNHLRHLDVGQYSFFEVDDFIINGDVADGEATRNEFNELFAPNVDLRGEFFAQRRKAYLSGKNSSPNDDKPDALLGLLPHCRRKLFFEWRRTEAANRLTPFLFLPEYLRLLEGDYGTLEQPKEQLITGLNRALTGLYVTDKDVLYVTSQYAHAVEQPVPVVRTKIPTLIIGLHVQEQGAQALDLDLPPLELRIPDPQFRAQPLSVEIDLLRFEYLMRLAKGGTPNVLAEECGLFVRELRDKLLASAGSGAPHKDDIEFFVLRDNKYELKRVRVDQQGRIKS